MICIQFNDPIQYILFMIYIELDHIYPFFKVPHKQQWHELWYNKENIANTLFLGTLYTSILYTSKFYAKSVLSLEIHYVVNETLMHGEWLYAEEVLKIPSEHLMCLLHSTLQCHLEEACFHLWRWEAKYICCRQSWYEVMFSWVVLRFCRHAS